MKYFVIIEVKKIVIICALVVCCANMKAQDPQFTQFYSVPLYLSPTFAGGSQQHRFSTAFRSQWLGIPGGFNTFVISYDRYISRYRSGVGFTLVRDQSGSGRLGYSMALLSYAYDIQINSDWHVRPGLNLQYSVLNLEFRKLIFSDQLTTGDATGRTTIELPPDNALKGDIDAAAAFLFYNQNIWFGTTVDHLFSPNMGLYADKSRVPYKISVFGGIQLNRQSVLIKPIDESLSFAYLYKRQGAFSQLDLGVYWAKIPAVFGFWYRGIPGFNSQRGDAISLLIGYKSYYFSIGYSYDFTVSGLVNSTYGAHEVSLLYPFVTSRRKKIHAVPCPQF